MKYTYFDLGKANWFGLVLGFLRTIPMLCKQMITLRTLLLIIFNMCLLLKIDNKDSKYQILVTLLFYSGQMYVYINRGKNKVEDWKCCVNDLYNLNKK
jgi:hypothetical protein